jgi:hypothetical protein
MRAIVVDGFGPPERLLVGEVAERHCQENGMLDRRGFDVGDTRPGAG